MRVSVLAACLLAALSLAATGQEGLGEQNCRATTAIVATAMDARRAGQPPAAVKKRLSEGPEAMASAYLPTVGPLVDWVFGLAPEMLTMQVAAQFETQCLAYKP